MEKRKLVVIGLENPPYGEPQAEATRSGKTQKGSFDNYITVEMKKEVKGTACKDLVNKFIWSGFKYYFDYYVVYSPVKYFKSQHLVNKVFLNGAIVNRADFHATEGGISIMSWKNEEANNDEWVLENVTVKKVSNGIGKLLPALKEDKWEVSYTSYSGTPDFKNGYLASSSKGAGNAGGVSYCLINDELKKRLPLFAANCYVCKDYTEKEVIMKSGDGGTAYQQDQDFLEDCFIWCCLTDKNKGSSFSLFKDDDNEICKFHDYSGTPDFKHGTLGNIVPKGHLKPKVLGTNNIKQALPLFAANCYVCKDYTEKEVIMKSGDGGTAYQQDQDFLEDCFIWCCLTDKNKCKSS